MGDQKAKYKMLAAKGAYPLDACTCLKVKSCPTTSPMGYQIKSLNFELMAYSYIVFSICL